MSGLWTQEWRLFWKAPGVKALLLALAALSLLGAWNGAQRVAEARAMAAEAVAKDTKSFADKRAKLVELEAGRIPEGEFGSPRKAHQAVLSAQRPLTPPDAELGVLSAAEMRPAPDLLSVSIQSRHRDDQPTLDDPTNRLDGPFDLAFVATWLTPLVVLFLAYDVLSRDREQGTAALLASQGMSLGRLAAIRLGVRFTAVFVVVGGVGVGAALWTEGAALSLPALAAWLVALALTIGFWLALAGAVNARARNAAAASLALLGIWVATSLLAPAAISGVVSAVAPPPDKLAGVLALRDIESDLNRRRREVSAAFYAARPTWRPVVEGDEFERYFVQEYFPRTLAFDVRYSPIARAQDRARVEQAEALRTASIFSPALAFKTLTEDLAGGAPERRVAFLTSVDDFHSKWREHFAFKLASMRPLTLADYDTKPVFEAAPEAPAARWGRVLGLLGALSTPFLIALVLAWRGLRRAGPL